MREVSEVNQKGRHTTTTAELIQLDFGGWVVDTPGVRQFQLWDMRPEEVEGFFAGVPAVRAAVRVPGLHAHARGRCAVKRAVRPPADQHAAVHSYLGMFTGMDSA